MKIKRNIVTFKQSRFFGLFTRKIGFQFDLGTFQYACDVLEIPVNKLDYKNEQHRKVLMLSSHERYLECNKGRHYKDLAILKFWEERTVKENEAFSKCIQYCVDSLTPKKKTKKVEKKRK